MAALDPLTALEQRIEAALGAYEVGAGGGWTEVEEFLTEAYGRLLSLEAIRTRLERLLSEPVAPEGEGAIAEERRDLERFRDVVLADVARLRQSLGSYKTRGLEARGRFQHAAG